MDSIMYQTPSHYNIKRIDDIQKNIRSLLHNLEDYKKNVFLTKTIELS